MSNVLGYDEEGNIKVYGGFVVSKEQMEKYVLKSEDDFCVLINKDKFLDNDVVINIEGSMPLSEEEVQKIVDSVIESLNKRKLINK